MRVTGNAELNIAHVEPKYFAAQVDFRGTVQPYRVLPLADPSPDYGAGGCLYADKLPIIQPAVEAPARDTAGSVAAHFALAAVVVVKDHLKVAARIGALDHHKPVGAYREAAGAKALGESGVSLAGYFAGAVVDDDKIVPGSLYFRILQVASLL